MAQHSVRWSQIALQTWTIRRELLSNAREILGKIQSLGIKDLEVANVGRRSPEEFAKLCREFKLKIIGTHEPPLTSGNLNTLIDEIRRRCDAFETNVVTVTLDTDYVGRRDAYFEYAVLCSRAGEVLKDHGIDLCYHPYHHDLAPFDESDRAKCGLDILLEKTPPEYLSLELDVYFIYKARVPMETVLDKFALRCKMVHLCDIDEEQRRATIGKGTVPWVELVQLLRNRCKIVGWVLEDDTLDPLTSIREGLNFWRDKVERLKA